MADGELEHDIAAPALPGHERQTIRAAPADGSQHGRQVGRERDAITQRDRDIEYADHLRLSHDTGCYPRAE